MTGIGDRVTGVGSIWGQYRGEGDNNRGLGLMLQAARKGGEKEADDMDMGQGYIDTKQGWNVDRGG